MMVSTSDKKKRKRKKVDTPAQKKTAPPTEDLSNLDADDFMASFGDDEETKLPKRGKTKAAKPSKAKKAKLQKSNNLETANKADHSLDEEENPQQSKNKKVGGLTSGKEVMEGLSKLEETDADFYKFLQQNDPELLNFSGDDSEDLSEDDDSDVEAEEDSQSDENEEKTTEEIDEEIVEEEEENIPAEPAASTSTPITKQLLKKWELDLKRNSLPSWRQLCKAFQAAVVTAKGGDTEEELKYTIIDPDMVNKVIMLSLGCTCEVLKHHLGDNPTSSPKWAKVKMSLKSYLTSLTELLSLLTSNDVLCAVMRHCKAMLPYYAAFSRLIKKYVKEHIMVWGSKAELSRVVAFTCLQAVVRKIPTFLEDLLKKMYVEYTKCSKMMSPKSRDVILLMRNCLLEMFKINPSVTYTTGFLYIRQLAVTLRSVIVNKKDVETVYNWQFVNCLHVWVGVLAECDACLNPLIFPLIQVMMGVLKLHNSPCFFPLHLHTMRMLLHLASQTNKHIPLIHPLLGVLEFCVVLHKSPATKPIDLTCVLRVTKGYKKTKAYQDGVFDLVYELLLNYTSQLTASISFPEVSFPISVWLKKFNKRCNNPKYTSQVRVVLDKMEVVARDVSARRSSVSFSPKDLDLVTQWENELPESALAKYFGNWLKIHRSVQAKEEENAAEENSEDEEEEEKVEEEEESSPKKKKKSKTKLKSEKGASEVSEELSESKAVVLNGTKKKKKKKEKNEKSDVAPETAPETAEFVDNGDVVEDIVLSD